MENHRLMHHEAPLHQVKLNIILGKECYKFRWQIGSIEIRQRP